MSNTTQRAGTGGFAENRARKIGAGAIPCYSLFRRIHSLIRQNKFPDLVRREFARNVM
jgi:hypothetical protein